MVGLVIARVHSKTFNPFSCLLDYSFSFSLAPLHNSSSTNVMQKFDELLHNFISSFLFSPFMRISQPGVTINAHLFHLFCVSLLVLLRLLFSMSNFELDLKSCEISCKCVEGKSSSNINICISIA